MPNYHSPENEPHFREVKAYIENEPEPDYEHAPDAARQEFLDTKYGIRVHWGLYSMWNLQHESWPLLKMSLKRRQAFQQLYTRFNPTAFNAGEWMELFKRVGLECFAITTKHHEGFSLFDTQTRVRQRVNWTAPGGPQIEACDLAYSVMDSPFKRDIIGELCAAARARDIRIDLYYSHPDWYDADFRPYCFHPLQTPRVKQFPSEYGTPEYIHALSQNPTWPAPERTPEETRRLVERHRTQMVELLTHYGPVDMLCLDMWLGKDVWPELRETIKLARRLQPNVMLRLRGIGNYGDYNTPEGFVPEEKSNTDMPWMVIYPLARSFSYDPAARYYKGSRWIVHNLVSSVAKGGSFMVGIGADGEGKFHPRAIQDLEGAGEWLKVNGAAIYGTRMRDPWHEGDDVLFTRAKDAGAVFAICLRWPGRSLVLNSVQPREGLRVSLLGAPGELAWKPAGAGIRIAIPSRLQPVKARPCRFAYAFKIEGK